VKSDAAGAYAKETLPTLRKHLETALDRRDHRQALMGRRGQIEDPDTATGRLNQEAA
jgi:hypothetical protein